MHYKTQMLWVVFSECFLVSPSPVSPPFLPFPLTAIHLVVAFVTVFSAQLSTNFSTPFDDTHFHATKRDPSLNSGPSFPPPTLVELLTTLRVARRMNYKEKKGPKLDLEFITHPRYQTTFNAKNSSTQESQKKKKKGTRAWAWAHRFLAPHRTTFEVENSLMQKSQKINGFELKLRSITPPCQATISTMSSLAHEA
jgi:hypothetical protein